MALVSGSQDATWLLANYFSSSGSAGGMRRRHLSSAYLGSLEIADVELGLELPIVSFDLLKLD